MSKHRLSSIFDLQMGKTPVRAIPEYWNDGANDWVSIADLSTYQKYVSSTKETITKLGVEKSGIKLVPPNTVIMSFKLSLGKTAITSSPVYTNEAIMAFVDKGIIELLPDYIYYQMKSTDWSSINGTNKAVKGVTLNKASLSKHEIEVPVVSEQKRIVAILDKVTTLIEKRKAQIKKLDQLIKSRFIKMFGDPVTNPKDWAKAKLGSKCEIITGNTPPRANKANYGDFIEWIKSDNISSNSSLLTIAEECLSEEGLQKSRSVNAGSILMTCIAGSIKSIGNVAIADREVAFNQQINAIVPGVNSAEFMYWQFILSKDYLTNTVNMALKGILSKGKLAQMEFIFPPLSYQNKFATFVQQIDKSKFELQQGLEKLETTYKSLMQEYFG